MASQFSIFAPSGIRFTRRKPHSERIYESLRDSWGSLFTDDPEAAINVETFAQAKCLGAAKEQLERAGNQANPRYCNELLLKLEADFRIVPPPGASNQERRSALIAARAVKGGALRAALEDGLEALLGDGFVALVAQDISDTIGGGGVYPDNLTPHNGPGRFAPLGDPFKVVRLTTHSLGVSVGYAFVAGYDTPLMVDEVLTVGPSDTGLTETVTITGSSGSYFSATFANPHDVGTMCTTAPVPYWVSGRRIVYAVVSDAVLADAVLMRQANNYLCKALPHACQWALVASSGSGTSGPFVIGESMLGQTPIVQVTY
jgi:hypothetical protein